MNESLILENLMNEESVTHGCSVMVNPTMDLSCKDTNSDEESKNNNGNQNVNIDDIDENTDKDLETYKIAVSVHDEQVQDTNSSLKSTANILHILSTKEKMNGRENDDTNLTIVTKTTSSDTQTSLATSIFYTEKTVLGASTSSLTSISSSTNPYRPAGPAKHRRITGYIDENDLSTPYNHYRCLSPNEHYGRSIGSRFLKRQFSLDRPDETVYVGFTEQINYQQQLQQQQQQQQQLLSQQNLNMTPKLYKQNSAGAANDLERIEEVPSTPTPVLQHYRQAASVSLSVESLTLR